MHDEQPNATHRGTGRPATIDPEAVAAIALRLFEARGYESVSMEDIATAAGIGRKSLYRYFPTKAALVWGGLDEAVSTSRSLMMQGDVAGDPFGVLLAAGLAPVDHLPDLAVTRGRLLLIGAYEELATLVHAKLKQQRVTVRDYLADTGADEDIADYLAAAYSACLFAGWLRWARSDQEDPRPILTRALSVIRLPE
ncbi:TetR family transcriptional regulator [Arthrobacter sp. MYb227]|uniref:TetR family transcriptional regulator n=1 Tax=Arthrobacter sp. MYb227 TaxID=1848601 RepID=UPI000CFC1A0B|nr:TetR family transcriptional regulator [Arthrobacter sp. MYb227]PQZ92337.1 TetR family transcriptional regulator [Arthrobacter sp. MYb227]